MAEFRVSVAFFHFTYVHSILTVRRRNAAVTGGGVVVLRSIYLHQHRRAACGHLAHRRAPSQGRLRTGVLLMKRHAKHGLKRTLERRILSSPMLRSHHKQVHPIPQAIAPMTNRDSPATVRSRRYREAILRWPIRQQRKQRKHHKHARHPRQMQRIRMENGSIPQLSSSITR